MHPHRAACNCAGGQKIRGRRSIALDMNPARALILLARQDGKHLPVAPFHDNAETLHQIQCNFNVGPRNQFADHLDGHCCIARH